MRIARRWLIGLAVRLIQKALTLRQVDPTLQRYLASIIGVVLNIVLVIGILGFFGFETTSFAALLAAAGIAIGAAWSGLLANFASGAFLMVLRPFKVGDYVDIKVNAAIHKVCRRQDAKGVGKNAASANRGAIKGAAPSRILLLP